ncbi:MAG: hypothetical protein LBR17_02765 [Bacteroidales bacterium]|jgi:vacuolar-type H+-ATPase subunit H|nr:hypothetical protein [Bacteroidales bacterium]
MRKIYLTTTFLSIFVLAGSIAEAQIGSSIMRRAKDKAETTAKRKAEEKAAKEVEKATEKAVEEAFDSISAANERQQAEWEKVQADNKATADKPVTQTPKKKRASTGMTASNAYFAVKEGTTLVYEQQDKKGKAKSQSRTTILSVSGTPQNMKVGYEVEILDKNGKSMSAPVVMKYTINIEDGVIYFDNLGNGITIEGEPFAIPADIKAGEELEDYSIKIMGMKATVTDIKCLAIENITTKAGTFKAAKIVQTTNAKVFGISSSSKTITYYVQSVGAVRTETYDKDGNIQQIEELVSLKQ